MKNKIFTSAIALIGFIASSNAQVSATADVEATIVTPIAIVKDLNGDMNFGNVAVTSLGGTVVLNPQTELRSLTGGVTLPVVTGTVRAASFTVSGQANYTYAITLPLGDLTIENPASDDMIVNEFASYPSATGVLSELGDQTLKVGATLNVSGLQPAGVYSSATPFDVTVNYN